MKQNGSFSKQTTIIYVGAGAQTQWFNTNVSVTWHHKRLSMISCENSSGVRPVNRLLNAKHRGRFLLVWDAISRRSLGPFVILLEKIKAHHCLNILGDISYLLLLFLPHYSLESNLYSKTTMLQSTLLGAFKHSQKSMTMKQDISSGPLHIVEHVWEYLESKHRARIPPPVILLGLQTALQEESIHIRLNIIHDFQSFILRHIQYILHSKGGLILY